MARGPRSSTFEDLITFASRTRWWVSVLAAVIVYILFHQIATMPVASPGSGRAISQSFPLILLKALFSFLQYLLPAGFLLGAFISVTKRIKREALHSRAAAGEVASMSWQEFELLVGEAFRRAGYQVIETGGGGADGGVDLVLKQDGERHLVQCKHWRAFKVGVAPVRELYGVMTAKGAASGFVVTSGTFTEQAREFARGRNIDLVDGDELLEIIHMVRSEAPRRVKEPPAAYHGKPAPSCPYCHAPMVRRTAKIGPKAGTDFLGCSRYPACKGVLQL